MKTTMVAAVAVVLACLISATSTAGAYSDHSLHALIVHQHVDVETGSRALFWLRLESCRAFDCVFAFLHCSHGMLQDNIVGANAIS